MGHRFSLWTRCIARIRYVLWQFVLGITFYTFPFSQFVKNMANSNSYANNIAFHVTQLIAVVLFMITSVINPGIIPPSKQNQSINGKKGSLKNESLPLLQQQQQIDYKYSFEPIEINLSNPPSSYCSKCRIIAPFRAAHDDNIGCVARFDHHSNWIGNAIGANNHRFYFILLVLESFLYISAFALKYYIFAHLVGGEGKNEFNDPFGWAVLVLVMLYLFALTVRTVRMLIFNAWYLSYNRTMYEVHEPEKNEDLMRFLQKIHPNEEFESAHNYDVGFIYNWIACFSGYKKEKQYFYGMKCVGTQAASNAYGHA